MRTRGWQTVLHTIAWKSLMRFKSAVWLRGSLPRFWRDVRCERIGGVTDESDLLVQVGNPERLQTICRQLLTAPPDYPAPMPGPTEIQLIRISSSKQFKFLLHARRPTLATVGKVSTS